MLCELQLYVFTFSSRGQVAVMLSLPPRDVNPWVEKDDLQRAKGKIDGAQDGVFCRDH